ncbi:hypothetical protein AK812_SmicGene28307 [Symbiodinium microadriaticum]|uniref:Uncharacterized protein n=1 Tax=Symbiodinium microadriaticum TaxID=2951 RepID=A0A1Q9D4N0_SYMMI|nr:hypothetical protein AK812_SmicGene28307 [Symbiodinium microadriaticum]
MVCLIIGSCLIQRDVPQYFEMAMYASYLEMLDRFTEIGWGVLERAFLLESPSPEHHIDPQVPDKYKCDSFDEPVTYDGATATYNGTSLLQGDAVSALEMSAALGRATDFTHRLLDAHTEGASMEPMVQQITDAWRPLCHRWSCDPENFWDIHYASHQQTVMLIQTDSASTLRREIRQRLKLERRVRAFMVDRYEWFGSLMQSTERSSVRNFFDVTYRSDASVDTWKAYGRSGKAAMLRFAVPFTRAVARFNETRATQSFDQVEYRKFKVEQTTPARGDPSARALLAARESVETDEEDDGDEDSSDVMAHLEEDEVSAVARRHGKGFIKKVGKGIKKAAKKVGKAVAKVATTVAKAVTKVVAYLATLFACLGDLFEFVTVGYAKTIATGIDFGAGITVGDMLPGDIDTNKLNDIKASVNQLMKAEPPDVWISIDVAFAVGINTPASWVGAAVGGGACCSTSSCGAYFSVGILGTVEAASPTRTAAAAPVPGEDSGSVKSVSSTLPMDASTAYAVKARPLRYVRTALPGFLGHIHVAHTAIRQKRSCSSVNFVTSWIRWIVHLVDFSPSATGDWTRKRSLEAIQRRWTCREGCCPNASGREATIPDSTGRIPCCGTAGIHHRNRRYTGKTMRGPPSLMEENNGRDLGSLEDQADPESKFALTHQARAEAKQAFTHLDTFKRVQRALLRPAQDAEALSHAVLNNEPVLPDSLVQGQQGFEDLRDAPAPDVEEDDEQHFAFTERMKEWWSSALTWVYPGGGERMDWIDTATQVNTPILSPACVFGAVIGDPVTGFKCTQVMGASITAFCCNFNLLTGSNDCR